MAAPAPVVVVGGGIAGASLAYALASAGTPVTVLEATVAYRDRVRGETVLPWGVREARSLGVEQVLRDAGAHVAPVWKRYGEDGGDPLEIPVAMLVPDVMGTLNLHHPVACQAIVDAAAGAGAEVWGGVGEVTVSAGGPVTVSYVADGRRHEMAAGLVVGADGRASTVRRQAGIALERQAPVDYVAGLLVAGLDGVPDDHDVVVDGDDTLLLAFHQGGGRARVYLACGLSGRHRFAGAGGSSRFLRACAASPLPWAERLGAATAAGPCATYPGDDTWTSTPYAEGVVLVGDAAGHNDPIAGQGLSMAMRDARIVRDIILDGGRSAADFTPYGEERGARMARLRLMADVFSVQIEDADNRPARRDLVRQKLSDMDPAVVSLLLGLFSGPETVPNDLLDGDLLGEIRRA